MNKVLKSLSTAALVLLATIITMGVVNAAVRSMMNTEQSSTVSTKSAEPSYMGITKADYLEVVGNNGQDTAAVCAYTYLIDTYGLEATYKMDRRADKDINDVDPAIYEAIDRCL